MCGFSLDCLTLPDVTPVELIRIAAETGYEAVSLWVQPPWLFEPMRVDRSSGAEITRALSDHGITLGNLEVFNLNTDAPIEDYEAAIAFGASLGARTATAIDFGERRWDIAERIVAFQTLCNRHGIATLIEPIAMGNVRTLQDGADLIAAAGVDARLVLDCLHFVRTGSSIDMLRTISADRIGYIQLCDGPAVIAEDQRGAEATANRLYPGEGEFPLADILSALPHDVTVGIETPNAPRQERGISPADRARQALRAAQTLMEQVEGRTR